MSVAEVFQVGASILLSTIGAGGIIVFSARWLAKVWADKILEGDRARYARELEDIKSQYAFQLERLKGEHEVANRKIQAELEKTLHVYRVQFEMEFKALSDIWTKLTEVRLTMQIIRPRMSVGYISDPEDRKIQLNKRISDFGEAFNRLLDSVHNQRPFYPEEIFQQLDSFLNIAGRELNSVRIHAPSEPGWYDEGEKNYNGAVERAESIAVLIRDHFARTMVH